MSPGSSACFRVIQSPPESFSSVLQCISYIFSESSPLPEYYLDFNMVRTRGGSRLRPRVRFSTPEREALAPVPAPVPSLVPEAVPEETQGFRRYQTRMGPRAPLHVPRRRVRGLDPPSGPAHRTQASHLPLGRNHHQSHLLQRRHHHLSWRQPPRLGGRYS